MFFSARLDYPLAWVWIAMGEVEAYLFNGTENSK
jgi:hypothetical protein